MTQYDDDLGEDPFGAYQPTVGVAVVALEGAEEAEIVIDNILLLAGDIAPDSEHPTALYARSASARLQERVAEQVRACRANVEAAKASYDNPHACHDAVDRAVEAYASICAMRSEALSIAEAMKTPDAPPVEPPSPQFPPAKDWKTVSAQVEQDTLAWGARVRGMKGRTLVLKPSPGSGKTHAMASLALQEQKNRQRVIFAPRTKELVEDVVNRVRQRSPYVRLHVIQGRDEQTCNNFENVKAVQEHGYAPGRAVCFSCDYHPRNAIAMGLQACEYFRSRVRAQVDTHIARRGAIDYPLIATTHASFVAATESGGGQYGSFWPCDLLLIDEDPTDAFETTVEVDREHAAFRSRRPEDRAANTMAALVRALIDTANSERSVLRGVGYKDKAGTPSHIHNPIGSLYAGRDLYDLLDRVVGGAFGQVYGIADAMQVLRDAADSKTQPAVGALHGATTTAAVNAIVPPATLAIVAEALYREMQFRESIRMLLHEKTFGAQPLIPTMSAKEMQKRIRESAEMHDTVYATTLECGADNNWTLRTQQIRPLLDQGTNVVIGDAYAHVEHYRQLLDKPATMPGNPSWTDPVTVIDHLAHFPKGTIIFKVLTPASITSMDKGQWHEHSAMLASLLRQLADKRVLIYGHKRMREKVEKLFEENDNFGVTEWAFEHWWGGRGKDQYRYFDTVVTITEPVQNHGGMANKVNARALRDAERNLARGEVDLALQNSKRILNESKGAKHSRDRNAGKHWRIVQEHERQNVNELSQAIHRVRPLIDPRTVIVMGDNIPLTRDTAAASAWVNHRVAETRNATTNGCMNATQVFACIEAIEDAIGIYSPSFAHAFFDIEMWLELGGFRSLETAGVNLRSFDSPFALRSSLERTENQTNAGSHMGAPTPDMPGAPRRLHDMPGAPLTTLRALGDPFADLAEADRVAHAFEAQATVPLVALTLVERVWSPPPQWEALRRQAQKFHGVKTATEMLNEQASADLTSDSEWFTATFAPNGAGRGQHLKWFAKRRAGRNVLVEGMRCAAKVFEHYTSSSRSTKSSVPF